MDPEEPWKKSDKREDDRARIKSEGHDTGSLTRMEEVVVPSSQCLALDVSLNPRTRCREPTLVKNNSSL